MKSFKIESIFICKAIYGYELNMKSFKIESIFICKATRHG